MANVANLATPRRRSAIRLRMRWLPLGAMLGLLTGCTDSTTADSGSHAQNIDYSAGGAWTPARHTSILEDKARNRTLTIETWYPATATAAETSILALAVNQTDSATYENLLSTSPDGCPSRTTTAVVDAEPAAGAWPVIAMSHCHECTRFSTVTVAEHLASHGFVVVAPDHAGNTLFDALTGDPLPLDTDTLALRAADLSFALQQTYAGALVAGLETDSARLGVFGHSFGAVTAGIVLQDKLGTAGGAIAAMFVGAPPENPFLAGVSMDKLDAPLMFESLAEDHSVGAAGNLLIANNFAAAPSTAWHFTVADAGHWSPSDLVGLTDDFMPGCWTDNRQETGEDFAYIEPSAGRALTASLAAAFFGAYVAGDSGGVEWLTDAMSDSRVIAEAK